MTSLMPWLAPAAGPGRDYLAVVIGRLAAACGAPRFEPHVTMAGTVHADQAAAARTLQALVSGVASFRVTFTGVGHEQDYFRSVYLSAEPSARLTALHQAAERAWRLEPRPYRPHLSLLYSGLTEEQKRPVIESLDVPLPLTIRIAAAELWAGDHEDVRGWRRVARVPLVGG